MKFVNEEMWAIWESGRFVGDDRPVTRATISKNVVSTAKAPGRGGGVRSSDWRTILFGQDLFNVFEIPHLQTVTIDRRLGADASTMTLTFLNQTGTELAANLDEYLDPEVEYSRGPTRRDLREIGEPGYYTYRRGETEANPNLTLLGEFPAFLTSAEVNPWNYPRSGDWSDMFIPNRLIRTYQGYGSDGAGFPHLDSKLTETGVWLIDQVEYSSSGLVTVTCRDLAKLLIEQRIYPPIIPLRDYPLEFCADSYTTETIEGTSTPGSETTTTETIIGQNVARWVCSDPNNLGSVTSTTGDQCPGRWDSSNVPWTGNRKNASVYGHYTRQAFDGRDDTYWLSIGNALPNAGYSFEWLQAACSGEQVNQVRFLPWKGGYRVYVSVMENGAWQGTSTVPYVPGNVGAPNDSNKPYVTTLVIPPGESWVEIDLPRIYNADFVRVTFTNLQDSNLGTNQYRAGVRRMQARVVTEESETVVVPGEETPDQTIITTIAGNIADYTDIVKLFCAWGGFYWPYGSPDDELLRTWARGLTGGRVWGDFMYSGAAPGQVSPDDPDSDPGPPCIPPSTWDNKSLMDGINVVKEILGFLFYVDTWGGAVFRPPNIWRTGNYVTGHGYVGGDDTIREIDEAKVLLDYGVTLDDTNLRSNIIVVSSDDPDKHASYTSPITGDAGYGHEGVPSGIQDVSLLGGQQRVMLVPNFPFQNMREIRKFAFLTSLWTYWTFRKSRFRIPGMPAFEPDDQVRIFERVTAETYVHYIEGVSSTMDMRAGTWYMDIDTHWLGNGPGEAWSVNRDWLDPGLLAYLDAIGQLDPNVEYAAYEPLQGLPFDPIRTPAHYAHLFPEPPELVWPDPSLSTEDVSGINQWLQEPSSGTGGGQAFNCSNQAKFTYWGSVGNTANFETILFVWAGMYPAQTENIYIKVDKRSSRAWRALAKIFEWANYRIYSNQTWSQDTRKIAGSTQWSNHAWGLAVDVNSSLNGRGTTPSATMYAIGNKAAAIKTGNGKPIFRWGGYWSWTDPMHFEVCIAPDDIATGVVLPFLGAPL